LQWPPEWRWWRRRDEESYPKLAVEYQGSRKREQITIGTAVELEVWTLLKLETNPPQAVPFLE
jgi:hypothetical protein